MSKNTPRVIASLFLLLFLSFQSGRMFCYHTHVFGDRVISHSHPFNNPESQHTVSGIEAISVITSSALTDCIADVPEIVSDDSYRTLISDIVVAAPDDTDEYSLKGRAPPVA